MTAERDAERERALGLAQDMLSPIHRGAYWPSSLNVARALLATDEALREAEKQRDALLAAIQAEPPDDATVRYFQRLHGLPEVGLRDDVTRLREAEAEVGRLRAPYHECVSLTYNPPEKWQESILRIRRRLKTAIGWWTSHDEQLEAAALAPKESA